MMELALSAFFCGLALGALGALVVAQARGWFNPIVKVTIAVRGTTNAPIDAVIPVDEHNVLVRPTILVDWNVIHQAAAGAGCVMVPKDMAPPVH